MARFNRAAERIKRHKRLRKKVSGTSARPRLCIAKTLRHLYAQVIDDSSGQTLAAASSMEKAVQTSSEAKNKLDTANKVGKIIGQRAMETGIKNVVFDRNGFLYHGRIKAVSEGAREAGLKF